MLETLFYFTYYSFLKGNFEKASMYFAVLREEFKAKKDTAALSKQQYKELKNIRESLQTGKIRQIQDWVEEYEVYSETSKQQDIKQRSLVKKIHYQTFDELSQILEASSNFQLYNVEQPCRPYGYVDMVYIDDQTIYPVEIKSKEGRHDIIGQIEKYALFFKLHTHEKLYECVQPVTICRDYDKHTLASLRRAGVKTLRYRMIKDKISIKAV